MAYVVDLEEEDNDLPTTLLRSVHDCPVTESTHDINTSNMLIQVTQFHFDQSCNDYLINFFFSFLIIPETYTSSVILARRSTEEKEESRRYERGACQNSVTTNI